MKRCRIGAGLLAGLLICAVLVSWAMDAVHIPVTRDLALAAQIQEEEQASAFAASAEKTWNRWRILRSCFADHSPTEEIDAQFAALKIYSSDPSSPDFSACAAQLSQMVEAVAQAHRFSLGNFF